ncbi:PLP-dependent lyase/thiolase [Oceanidesulfovibrio marinus]|uniref:PLP-dependent lyase/thiolase n=1 Tax=Oceanidesulfovibrio marinus TaxID=370038 RepID=A0ABX6NIB1_9BACT|nr:PLP-dependent lyase/thiolase [Oceanidesulfovibrio marinus]QJT09355.1 PLP-dependent lyase/thiolase [Oceanidesulfovibrio marinus]
MDMALHCPACAVDYRIMDRHFACPKAQPDAEHLLRQVHRARPEIELWRDAWDDGERGSFRVFRNALSSHLLAGEQGYLAQLEGINDNLMRFHGLTFEATALFSARPLAAAIGHDGLLLAKDETANVGGSNTARHLMGTLLYIEAHRRLTDSPAKTPLAIHSCGDAALGAAIVARAGEYPLHCFVPRDVDPELENLLRSHGAYIEKVIPRTGELGDPCYRAFREAVSERGFLPFATSGPDNWSGIEGGRTLGYELALQLSEAGIELDHLVLQVGGGAMARAVVEALESCREWGMLERVPRIHAVQPTGSFPFVRCHALLLAHVADVAGLPFELEYDIDSDPEDETAILREFLEEEAEQVAEVAAYAADSFATEEVQQVLARAVANPTEFMWPWDLGGSESAAHGLLHPVAHDWFYLAAGMLRTGGVPAVATEESLANAKDLVAGNTNIAATASGTAGLAGLTTLKEQGHIAGSDAVGIVLTSVDRASLEWR